MDRDALFSSGMLAGKALRKASLPKKALSMNFSKCQDSLIGSVLFYCFLGVVLLIALCIDKLIQEITLRFVVVYFVWF